MRRIRLIQKRILYEKTLRGMRTREFTSQYLSPPIILHLSMQEENVLKEHIDTFANIGFEIEVFGGDSYAVRAIPDNLFGIAKKAIKHKKVKSQDICDWKENKHDTTGKQT